MFTILYFKPINVYILNSERNEKLETYWFFTGYPMIEFFLLIFLITIHFEVVGINISKVL